MDTVKTRLVLQGASSEGAVVYKGVRDCFLKVFREEGIGAFYISLLPRLASVVPMISIQFGVYEIIKGRLIQEKRQQIEREQLQRLRERMQMIRRRRSIKREKLNSETHRDVNNLSVN